MTLAVFSYMLVAILSAILLCNTLASGRAGRRNLIGPTTAFLLGLVWPIGLLAAWIAFVRGRT